MTSVNEYLQNKYGLRVASKKSTNATGTTAEPVLPLNPNRIYLIIMNLGANNGYVNLDPAVSSTNGILLTANGGSISLNADEDFNLPSEEWWGIQDTAEGTWLIIEGLIY